MITDKTIEDILRFHMCLKDHERVGQGDVENVKKKLKEWVTK